MLTVGMRERDFGKEGKECGHQIRQEGAEPGATAAELPGICEKALRAPAPHGCS